MTREELLIARHELEKRGYHYFVRYGQDPASWCLRARKHPFDSEAGRREWAVEVCTAEDLARLLRGRSLMED